MREDAEIACACVVETLSMSARTGRIIVGGARRTKCRPLLTWLWHLTRICYLLI